VINCSVCPIDLSAVAIEFCASKTIFSTFPVDPCIILVVVVDVVIGILIVIVGDASGIPVGIGVLISDEVHPQERTKE